MKLKKFVVNSGGKFSPDAPVLIDFSKSNYVIASGDEKLGKTTLLELFLMACGEYSGEKIIDKLKNKGNDKIDLDFEFVGKDRKNYQVKVTKSEFKLFYEGEKLGSPLTKMKEILGVVGANPEAYKTKPLADILKWMATYSNKNPEEVESRLGKIKDGIKASVKSRAEANNAAKGLREYLSNEPMYVKWEESEKRYIKEIDVSELSGKLKKAGDKSDKYIQNDAKVKGQKDRKRQIEDQIKSLQSELEVVEANISFGQKWLNENETAQKDYDAIRKQYDNAAVDAANYNKWQDIKRKKIELDTFEDLAQKADAKEKAFIQERKELHIEILPNIKGLEIISEDTHEDGGKTRKEGLYRYGISSIQMSGTEWMAIFLEMFKKNKGRILVVDSAGDLGSSFVEILEQLRKENCYILIAEMDREQKTLEIEYQ